MKTPKHNFIKSIKRTVGDLALKNGWKEGSAEKNALHALVGGIMSELGGSDFISGASGAIVNEMIQNKLAETFKDNPAMHQWASAFIGGVISEITSSNAQSGASTASSATKNNYILHGDQQYLLWNIEQYQRGEISREEFIDKMLYYFALDSYYNAPIFNPDNISTDLKNGGEWFPGSQIVNDSLMDIFIDNGIDIRHGFSYAFQQYLSANGINIYDYVDTINSKKQQIISQRGEFGNINTELIAKPSLNDVQDTNILTNHMIVTNQYDNYLDKYSPVNNKEQGNSSQKNSLDSEHINKNVDEGKTVIKNVFVNKIDTFGDTLNDALKENTVKEIPKVLQGTAGKAVTIVDEVQDYYKYHDDGHNLTISSIINAGSFFGGNVINDMIITKIGTTSYIIKWSVGAGEGILIDNVSNTIKDIFTKD